MLDCLDEVGAAHETCGFSHSAANRKWCVRWFLVIVLIYALLHLYRGLCALGHLHLNVLSCLCL